MQITFIAFLDIYLDPFLSTTTPPPEHIIPTLQTIKSLALVCNVLLCTDIDKYYVNQSHSFKHRNIFSIYYFFLNKRCSNVRKLRNQSFLKIEKFFRSKWRSCHKIKNKKFEFSQNFDKY